MSILSNLSTYWNFANVNNFQDFVSGLVLTGTNPNTTGGPAGSAFQGFYNNTVLSTDSAAPINLNTGSFEIRCLVWFNSITDDYNVYVKDNGTSQREYKLIYDGTAKRFKFSVFVSGVEKQVVADTFGAPAFQTWHEIHCYCDASIQTIGIIVDATAADTLSIGAATIDTGTAPLQVNPGGTDDPWHTIEFDEFSIWKGRILTSGERTFLYNSGAFKVLYSWNSVKSGAWSDPTVWDIGTVPLDGGTITIVSGHTVSFDVDQSAFVYGGPLTIHGTLQLTSTPGSYCLKLCAARVSIDGDGHLKAGSLSVPTPRNTKWLIDCNGQSYIDGTNGLQVELVATEPTHPWVRVATQVNGSDTQVTLDTDVSGDWQVGDTILLVKDEASGNTNAPVVIQSIDHTMLTFVDSLPSYLTIPVNSYAVNLTRNIRVANTNGSNPFVNCVGGTFYCEVTGGSGDYAFEGCDRCDIGGVIHGINAGYTSCTNCFPHAIVVGCQYGVYDTSTDMSSGYGGLFIACPDPFQYVSHAIITAEIRACGIVFSNCLGCVFLGHAYTINTLSNTCQDMQLLGTVDGISTLIYRGSATLRGLSVNNLSDGSYLLDTSGNTSLIQAYGCTFTGVAIDHYVYGYDNDAGANSGGMTDGRSQIAFYDTNGVVGDKKLFMHGGRIVTDFAHSLGAVDHRYQFIFERATSAYGINTTPVYMDIPLPFFQGQERTIDVWMQQDVTGMTETPRAQLIDPLSDPFYGGTALQEQVNLNNTGVHKLTLSYTAAYDRQLILRLYGRNASGNLYVAPLLRVDEHSRGNVLIPLA